MLKLIYTTVGNLEILIFMLLIASYIYLEKGAFDRKRWRIFWGMFVSLEILTFLLDQTGEWCTIYPFLFLSGYLWSVRKVHRIRGLFLIVPITGIVVPVACVPFCAVYLFAGSMQWVMDINDFWWIPLDFMFWLCLLLFLWKGKTLRSRYVEVLEKSRIAKWEKNILNVIGIFLLVVSMLIINIDEVVVSSSIAKGIVVCGIITFIFMEYAIVALSIQGIDKAYFQNVAHVNEYYLKAQLNHFRVYQKTQQETRRIRHDMKNHLSCLHTFLEKGNYDEAKQYIEKMNEQVHMEEERFHTGQDIIDVILNQKDTVARREGIDLFVEGVPGLCEMEALDICTIFANALDNAMEALQDMEYGTKWIKLEFRRHNGMQYIRFMNPVSDSVKIEKGVTTKKDKINHGFGLENIRSATEKYKGQMNCTYQEGCFILEILFTT